MLEAAVPLPGGPLNFSIVYVTVVLYYYNLFFYEVVFSLLYRCASVSHQSHHGRSVFECVGLLKMDFHGWFDVRHYSSDISRWLSVCAAWLIRLIRLFVR